MKHGANGSSDSRSSKDVFVSDPVTVKQEETEPRRLVQLELLPAKSRAEHL